MYPKLEEKLQSGNNNGSAFSHLTLFEYINVLGCRCGTFFSKDFEIRLLCGGVSFVNVVDLFIRTFLNYLFILFIVLFIYFIWTIYLNFCLSLILTIYRYTSALLPWVLERSCYNKKKEFLQGSGYVLILDRPKMAMPLVMIVKSRS